MKENLKLFGNLSLASLTNGSLVKLPRAKDEIVFLAFDHRLRRLVELHILKGESSSKILDAEVQPLSSVPKLEASGICGQSFMSILDVGNDDGLTYYTSSLNDGELAHEYIQRRGPLPVVTSLAIVHQLLRDLLNLGRISIGFVTWIWRVR